MGSYWKKTILLFLAMISSLSAFVGCDLPEEMATVAEDNVEAVEDFFPDIDRKDYNEDFYIYTIGGSGLSYIEEDKNSGSPIDEAVYNRQCQVERYLGIDVVGVKYADATWQTYTQYIQTTIQNMDGTLDVVMTHVTAGVPFLISNNLLLDFDELEEIDLNAEYWNRDFMNELELNGNYFLGLSDFNIIDTYVIAFNKEMMEQYNSSMEKSLYNTVRDMEWTIDKMIDLASLVYADSTGDGKSVDDTYGLTGTCWIEFAGFLTSSDIPIFEQDASGAYKVAINQPQYFERTDNLVEKLRMLAKSNYAYFDYPPDFHKISVPLTSGRVLMQTAATYSLPGFLNYDLEFGVLPYPMYDRDQASVGYKSLQWGGYIGVASYLKNPVKVGETLEMLSFYSKNVQVTYYEKLLGKQVADMPDDVAMFDLVWDGLSTDVGQTYVEAMGLTDRGLCYTVPELVDPSSKQNLASFVGARETVANNSFRKFLKKIK